MPKPIEELKGKDISLPRNPIITKLFRVVKLAENAGYGLDNIEYNWKKYNQTTPQFDVVFDSVIVKFQLVQAKKNVQEMKEVSEGKEMELLETLRKTFGLISGRVQKSPEENMADLKGLYETFTAYLQNNFGNTLENLRKEFGETLEEHQRKNTEKKVFVLMLITIDNFVLSEDVASIIGISITTINRYLKILKELGFISRVGSYKTGFWNFKKLE